MAAVKDILTRQNIEATADYYPASDYAFGQRGSASVGDVAGKDFSPLLTFYQSLTLEPDSLSGDFIPISSVAQNGRNPKLFAVGIIPPNQRVTGRLLDRSESIIRALPGDQFSEATFPDGVDGKPAPTEEDSVAQEGNPGAGGSSSSQQGGWSDAAKELPGEFWAQYVDMCRRLKQDPIELAAVIYQESGFNPAAVNYQGQGAERHPVAKGLNQYTKHIGENVGGMTNGEWDTLETLSASEQLPYVERFFKRARPNMSRGELYVMNFGKHNNPDGTNYASSAHQKAWIEGVVLKEVLGIKFYRSDPHPNDTFAAPKGQQAAIDQNGPYVTPDRRTGQPVIITETFTKAIESGPPQFIRQAIEDAQKFLDGGGSAEPLPVGPEGDAAGAWQGSGSGDAAQAKRLQGALAKTDLRGTALGQQLEAAQKAQIQAIQKTLEQMAKVPPLRMLINPSKFSVKSQKIAQDGNWSRVGPIIEFWGDDQDKISGSGTLAGFQAILKEPLLGEGGPGLTRSARNFSQSWQNFMALWLIYRNNGGVYLEDLSQSQRDLLLSTVGSVYLYYDNILYIGSFDSFSITEASEKPFSIEYSFEFTVRASFVLEFPDEQSYGADSGLFEDRRQPTLPTRTDAVPQTSFVTEQGSEQAAESLVAQSPAGDATPAEASSLPLEDELERLSSRLGRWTEAVDSTRAELQLVRVDPGITDDLREKEIQRLEYNLRTQEVEVAAIEEDIAEARAALDAARAGGTV